MVRYRRQQTWWLKLSGKGSNLKPQTGSQESKLKMVSVFLTLEAHPPSDVLPQQGHTHSASPNGTKQGPSIQMAEYGGGHLSLKFSQHEYMYVCLFTCIQTDSQGMKAGLLPEGSLFRLPASTLYPVYPCQEDSTVEVRVPITLAYDNGCILLRAVPREWVAAASSPQSCSEGRANF